MNPHSVAIEKYPRTAHLEGSRLQPGDEGFDQVPYASLAGRWIVVEEKMDGANAGVGFDADATLRLQSRGHYLVGGGRERHFDLLKAWASRFEDELFDVLGNEHLMYGEWMASKHTVYYDRLPHYFLEFDLKERRTGRFLSTAARNRLLKGSPVVSVPVLYEGIAPRRQEDLLALLAPSWGKSADWWASLKETVERQGLNWDRVQRETEPSEMAEGLYIKVEEGDWTVDRLKWVRSDFFQTLMAADGHWLSRPIIPNQLSPGVDLFASSPSDWSIQGSACR